MKLPCNFKLTPFIVLGVKVNSTEFTETTALLMFFGIYAHIISIQLNIYYISAFEKKVVMIKSIPEAQYEGFLWKVAENP